ARGDGTGLPGCHVAEAHAVVAPDLGEQFAVGRESDAPAVRLPGPTRPPWQGQARRPEALAGRRIVEENGLLIRTSRQGLAVRGEGDLLGPGALPLRHDATQFLATAHVEQDDPAAEDAGQGLAVGTEGRRLLARLLTAGPVAVGNRHEGLAGAEI